MPNYIKAMILVLVATSIVLYFIRDPLSSHYSKQEYREHRNIWWFLTFCLFLSPDIWIFYALVLLALLRKKYATDVDRVAAYLFLLFTAPSIEANLPGIGGINRLFSVDLQRILILVVLLPLFKKSMRGGLSVSPSDKWVVLYVMLAAAHFFRGDNNTDALRHAFLIILDLLIPYFVISRNIKSIEEFNRVILAVMFSLSMIAAEAVMEAARHWELYNHTGNRLIGERVFKFSGERAGILRARSIFLSPIILGFAMVFLMGLLLYAKRFFNRKLGFYVLFGITFLALLVTFSRAAWVGAVMLLAMYWLLASGFGRGAIYIGAGGLLGFLALTMTQFGQAILNLLPFFGGTERADTFDYRARLFENGVQVIKQNPWLGDHYYLQDPLMEQMRQGQGIIDTVNVYLAIAMRHGLIGLVFFVMIFVPSVVMIYRRTRRLPESEVSMARLGRMLVSYMAAALLIISTLSNSDFVPEITLIGAAFMAAWIRLSEEILGQESKAKVPHRTIGDRRLPQTPKTIGARQIAQQRASRNLNTKQITSR